MNEKTFGAEISAPLVGNIFREFSFQPAPPLYQRFDDVKAIASDLARSMVEAIEQKNGNKLNDIDRKNFLDSLTKETEKIVINTAKDIKKSIDITYERNGIPKGTDLAEATLKNPKLMEEILKDHPAKASDRVDSLLEKEGRKLEKQINKKDNPLDDLSTQKQTPLERVNDFIKNSSQKLGQFGSSMKESVLKSDFVKNAGQRFERFGDIMKGSLFKKETKSDEKTTEFSNIETPEPKQATMSSTIQPATPIIETAGPKPMSAATISNIEAPEPKQATVSKAHATPIIETFSPTPMSTAIISNIEAPTPMSAATISNIEAPEPKQATVSKAHATPIIETFSPTPMSTAIISNIEAPTPMSAATISNIEAPEPKQATVSKAHATPIIETFSPTPMSATIISNIEAPTPMSAATISNIETPEPKKATISSTIQPATPIIETAGPKPMSATLISDVPKSMIPNVESNPSKAPISQLDDKTREEIRGAAIKGVEIDSSQKNDKIKPSVAASSKVEETSRTR